MTGRPNHWPSGVEPITMEELEKLGRNANGELFWEGKRLITRSQFHFTLPQVCLAILAAIASLATIATGLNNASVFLCARNIAWLGCPNPVVSTVPLAMPGVPATPQAMTPLTSASPNPPKP